MVLWRAILFYMTKKIKNQEELFGDAVGAMSRLWQNNDNSVIIPYTLPEGIPTYEQGQIDRALE